MNRKLLAELNIKAETLTNAEERLHKAEGVIKEHFDRFKIGDHLRWITHNPILLKPEQAEFLLNIAIQFDTVNKTEFSRDFHAH